MVASSKSFVNGGSTYTGSYRSSNDFSRIGLFVRSELDVPREAAYYQQTTIESLTFDPLTITGAQAGSSLQVSMSLEGSVSPGTSDGPGLFTGVGFGHYVQAEFLVYVPNAFGGYWTYAPNQTTTTTYGGLDFETIDDLSVSTLTDYDPSLSYALSTTARISANLQRDDFATYTSSFNEVDAEHTARVTGLGFLGSGNSGATIQAASGTVYPQAVPEPVSLIAMGTGFFAACLRRRNTRTA